jgi:phospholipase C
MTNSKASQRSAGFTRREFLRRSATIAAAAALARGFPSSAGAAPKKSKVLPSPNKSGIEHVVVAMMENRSFDHLLGWLPGRAHVCRCQWDGFSHAAAGA